MLAEPAIETQKTFNAQRCQQERHCQSQRVNCQQKNSLAHRILRRRKIQNRRENWAHTRRPSKSKCKPHYKRPQGVLLPFTPCSRLSEYSALIFSNPVRCRPK